FRARTRYDMGVTREKKVAPGTRFVRYRCSLPGLAGFTDAASPGTITLGNFVCGERGIRTPDTFRYTRFPVVHLRPLGHLSCLQRRERDSNPLYPCQYHIFLYRT